VEAAALTERGNLVVQRTLDRFGVVSGPDLVSEARTHNSGQAFSPTAGRSPG